MDNQDNASGGATRRCPVCKEWKADDAFYSRGGNRTGLQSHCISCMYVRRMERQYGITHEDYLRMLEEQKGFCAICQEEPEEMLHVDHDHLTGRVRGLLCKSCNWALGHFDDDIVRLEAAIAYLKGGE